MIDFDAIVVGASIAGSTTTALLARSGYRVLLLDKARFPRPKVCGEGLMPAGAHILDRLGLLDPLKQDGLRAFRGLRLYPSRGDCLQLNFHDTSPSAGGWIVPRLGVDTRLAHWASRQPEVVFLEDFSVRGFSLLTDRVEVEGSRFGRSHTYRARLLIGADGIRSQFHRRLQIPRARPRSRRFALSSQPIRLRDKQPFVEVHFSSLGEAYVAPLQDDLALVTLLLFGERRQTGLNRAQLYFESLKSFPALWLRLIDVTPHAEVQATAPLASRPARAHAHRLLLVGDAAGAVDPVTGQGMTLALKDAELACTILGDRLRADDIAEEDLRTYSRERSRYFSGSYELAEFILSVFRHPLLARQAMRSLSRNRVLEKKALDWASNPISLRSLSLTDRLQLVLGV